MDRRSRPGLVRAGLLSASVVMSAGLHGESRAENTGGTGPSERALELTLHEIPGQPNMIELLVTANTQKNVGVRYVLNVSGRSTSRQAGATQITPQSKAPLSRVRVNKSPGWCAVLDVEQDDGVSYFLEKGECGTRA